MVLVRSLPAGKWKCEESGKTTFLLPCNRDVPSLCSMEYADDLADPEILTGSEWDPEGLDKPLEQESGRRSGMNQCINDVPSL